MEIRLCGRLAVEHDGESLHDKLQGSQGRLLLAYLALKGGRPVSRDELIEAVWTGRVPTDPRASLNTLLSRLRAALPEGAIEGRHELSLRVGPGDQLDVQEAEAALQLAHSAAGRGDWEEAQRSARTALGIAGGPLMPGHEAPWLDDWRRKLADLVVDALELSAQTGLRGEGAALAVAEAAARELVEREPYRESGYLLLMEVQAARGNAAEGLRVYERLRVALRDELGTAPGPAVKSLHEKLLRGEVVGVSEESGSRTTPATLGKSLPLPRSLGSAGDSPFVGRDNELAGLRELFAEVRAGARNVVALAGEPGIGKTRLAAELARVVHAEGALVLYGRCDEGLAVPYQPFVEAARPYTTAIGAQGVRAELGRLAPEITRLLPESSELGEPLRADAESERFALFEAVTALFAALTREQPALIVLDDLHWAATPTLLLLRHLVRSDRPLRALLLGIYRETDLDAAHPLAGLVADLQRDPGTKSMRIQGLNDEGVAALLGGTTGHELDGRSVKLVRLLQRETAGNPFFIRELLAHLIESGAIESADEHGGFDLDAPEFHVPDSVRQVVGQRVARLSELARRALSVAAVAGPTSSLTLLERILGEQSGVLDALDEAVAAGLLIDAGPGDYAFAHALVRETIYEGLSPTRRMRLHRELGEALEAVGGDVDAHAGALAHHFAKAAPDGQAAKAATYALAAGRSATARLGYEEAIAHYERGLKALELTGRAQVERCELLLGLGEARRLAGQNQRSRESFQLAAELAREYRNPEQLARAALGLTTSTLYPSAGDVDELGAGLLEEALAALGDEDTALRATLLANLSIMLHNAGSLERVRALAAEALATARRVRDRDALGAALHASAGATSWSLDPHGALARTAELLELAADSGDRELVLWARAWRVVNLLMLGELGLLAAEGEAFGRLVDELGVPAYRWWPLLWEAMQSFLEGRFEDSERLALEAFSIGQEAHEEAAALHFGTQLFHLRLMQGRLGELKDAVKAAVEQYPALPGPRCALAALYAELGLEDEARAEFESFAVDDFAALPQDFTWLDAASYLAPTCAFLSDAARAWILYQRLAPYAEYCVFAGWATAFGGPVSGYLGLLAATMASWEDAERHFVDAVDLCARLGARPFDARLRHDYARMLVARGKPGDRERAVELLSQALDRGQRLGMASLVARARDLRKGLAPGWRNRRD